MPQEPAPAAFLSPTENIVLALQLRGVARSAALDRASAVLAQAGLSERAHQPAERLSAGEAQRLGLARALACSNGLLVLDEPTSRLDRLAAATVAQRLADAARLGGHTIICATHDPDVIALAGEVVSLDS
jgi:ABC-type multidrug transport system ATPase subunit